MTNPSKTRHLTVQDATDYIDDLKALLRVINKELATEEEAYENLRFDPNWSEEKAILVTSTVMRLRVERKETLKQIATSTDILYNLKQSKRTLKAIRSCLFN